MRRVVWSDPALDDLASIRTYFGQFNPQAASRLAQRPVAAGNSLAEHAERGRAVQDHRELLAVPPYLIGYRIQDDTVQIIRVRHGARESLP